MAVSSRPDATAILLSIICLVHCLILPLAISILPTALQFLDLPEEVHAMIFVAAVPVSTGALFLGYRKHGLWLPGAIAGVGLIFIGAGAFAGLTALSEIGISVIGSLLLLAAHIVNIRARTRSKYGDRGAGRPANA